ncbi:MAG: radical SAM family heme chaperone HemW [Lachnospiraceae bacterium]|nr:radical SAM family heme chaperone HemW [Lachnospiraceae bacterium]
MELYIHIPFCVKKCEYCDFVSGAYDEKVRRDYSDALIREIGMYAPAFSDASFSTIYIGGGTPSWLEADCMDAILDALQKHFNIEAEAEFTMECNPGTVSADFLHMIKSHGVCRLSIGLQSTDDAELKRLGRIHDFNRFLHTYELARNAGFYDINVDIMTGIPGQNKRTLTRTLSDVIRLKPEHISCYSLIIEEGTPFYEKYAEDLERQRRGEITQYLPTDDEEFELYALARQLLFEARYEQYEISNFAREGYECIHNIGYWRRVPYLGLGLSAASFYGEHRYTNTTDIYEYMDMVNSGEKPLASDVAISRQDAMAEFMYLGLRMTEGISRADFAAAFDMDIEVRYGNIIRDLVSRGMLTSAGGRIALTPTGRDISNQLLCEFL